jgi:hypothetical protein
MTRVSLWILFIIFFALPYLVDVAYCQDLSLSHFAQAVLGDGEELELSETKACVSLPDCGLDHIASAMWKTDVPWPACQVKILVSPQYLFLAAMTSRPPPIL